MKDEAFNEVKTIGLTVMHELLKTEDPNVFRAILCASIEAWSKDKGYNALEMVASMDDAMHQHDKGEF